MPRAVGAFGVGAAAILIASVALFGASTPAPLGAPAIWIADRDADRVVALDRDLFVLRTVSVPAPIAIAVARDAQSLCILSVPSRSASGDRRLERICGDGTRSVVCDLDASFSTLAAPRADLVVVGSDAGRLLWIDASAHVLREVRVAGKVRDLAAEEGSGSVWVLLHAAESSLAHGVQLACYDVDGECVCDPLDASDAIAITTVPHERGVWALEPSHQRLRHFDELGRATGVRRIGLASTGGIEAVAGCADGVWLFASAGGVLARDAHGRVLAAQGGFDSITGVCAR